MTVRDYLADKIEAALARGLADPNNRLPVRAILKGIAAHERGLLAEFVDDFPILKTFDLTRFFSRTSMPTPYPTTFPAEAFDHVLAALRGQAEAKTLIHDAWEAAGFALGQFVGLPAAAVGAAPEVLTEEEAVQRVCLAFENTGGGTMKATAIPPFVWEMVLKACLQLLEKFLAK